MDMKESKRILAIAAAGFLLLLVMIYAIAYEQFRYQEMTSSTLSPSTVIGEIVDGMEIRQRIQAPAQTLTELAVMAADYDRDNRGELCFALVNDVGDTVAKTRMDVSNLENGAYTTIELEQPVGGMENAMLTLVITSDGCAPGSAVTLYAGNAISAGRFDIARDILPEECYYIGGQQGVGQLCIKLVGVNEIGFYRVYWLLAAGLVGIGGALCVYWWKQAKQGKNNPLVAVCTLLTRYRFLIKQLVIRDFKTKYKRSALGMVWSFLNPLMTMMVQYLVFSTIFKSDTPNYPVYLLTGIVFFSFFNQTVTAGLISITVNASLIKKVYIPKYIYPLSKVVSSLVNFLIALTPLFLVMIFTGTAFTPAMFLLIFDILCMTIFIAGMVLLLSTANTFFQDTEFLWGVVGMMWTYVTPIFYPESIIPSALMPIYRLNPMYQYITFARTCIIDGVSPAPQSYFACLALGLAVFALGAWVFKKKQDEFVLQL